MIDFVDKQPNFRWTLHGFNVSRFVSVKYRWELCWVLATTECPSPTNGRPQAPDFKLNCSEAAAGQPSDRALLFKTCWDKNSSHFSTGSIPSTHFPSVFKQTRLLLFRLLMSIGGVKGYAFKTGIQSELSELRPVHFKCKRMKRF